MAAAKETKSKLTQAQCNVMKAVGTISKTGKNDYHGYRYASEGDLLEAVQPAIAKEGLALRPKAIEYTDTDKGHGKVQTDVKVTYDLCHVSGETETIQVIGRGIDKEDKGMYKALTGALKYLIRHTFLVPTNEHDPEIHDAIHVNPTDPVIEKHMGEMPVERGRFERPAVEAEVLVPGSAPACPKCGDAMWDNSDKRRQGGKAPAYKCKKNKWDSKTKKSVGCEGIVWDAVEAAVPFVPAMEEEDISIRDIIEPDRFEENGEDIPF